MLFGIGFLLVIAGAGTVLRSPTIGALIMGAGFWLCCKGGDDSAERFMGVMFFLGLIGMVVAIFTGTSSRPVHQ